MSLSIAFAAYLSADITANGNAYTQIPFDQALYNHGGCFDLSTGKFKPSVAGVYSFDLNILVTAGLADQDRLLAAIYRKSAANPNELLGRFELKASGTNMHTVPVSTQLEADGEVDEFWFSLFAGGASKTIQGGIFARTSVAGALIAPASFSLWQG